MADRISPRSRRETRAAILEGLLRSKGAFRQEIAQSSRLTEASVSRILAELRSAGIIGESRIPAPYSGGPTSMVSLSTTISIAGIELSNDRLSFGVGDLSGATDYIERTPVPPRLDQAAFERQFRRSLGAMRDWLARQNRVVRQAALSIPGFGAADANPILPWDMARLRAFLAQEMADMPLALTNSVIAQAAFHRYADGHGYPVAESHLFLFAGHGVAGVAVRGAEALKTFEPVELGHMIIERDGATCRCGHRGCLEAYTSLRAISAVLGVPPGDILEGGDRFLSGLDVGAQARATLRERLFLLGLGVGNALNVQRLPAVVISGWPSLLPPEDRAAVAEGIDAARLGGFDPSRLLLSFIAPSIGNDPRAALAYAAYSFVSAGGREPLDARAPARGAEVAP